MGSKVVVTYKRKRLFSRSDRSQSKTSANFDNHEESIIAQRALQKNDTQFETCHECPKDQVGENILQCDSQHCISLCNNNNLDTTKRKLTSTLITFCRRSKRNKDNAAANDIASDKCASVTPLAASCSVDMKKNEKGHHAKTDPTTVAHEEIFSLGEKVCMGVQDVKPEEDLSNEDVNSRSMPSSNISWKRGSLSSLDLSISPPASRDIDCNIPLDCDYDENHLGSTSEVNKNTSTLQVPCAGNGYPVRAVCDKGTFIVESPTVKNNCIQLFPENRSNDPEKSPRFIPTSLQSSRVHNLVNGRAYYSSLYDWPQLQPREPFQDFLPSTSNRADSLSRHLMMLDNILTRSRGKFEFPATWSEEELDCLWIGVRRHGVNNWDAILRDPRLHFSPWKMTRDLADRWRDEQYRLFHGTTPFSQVKYTGRPDLLSGHTTGVQLSLGVQQNPRHECGALNRPPVVHYMDLARNRQFQKPVNYLSRSIWGGLINPSEGSDFGKGSLPHWLREAVEIPPRPSGPARNVVSSACNHNLGCSGNSQQLWVNTKNAPAQKTTEPCAKASLVIKSGKSEVHEHPGNNNNNNKQDDLIIINSGDASSEETISDDHSIRP